MSEFDDREKAEEARFARSDELRFKAAARRNRLLGLWAAEQMRLSGEAAKSYAASVVDADLGAGGDEGVARKVVADLAAQGVPTPDAAIRAKMVELMAAAKAQVLAEG